MHALSQLSYGPVDIPGKCSVEVEIVGPSHTELLIVPGRPEPEGERKLSFEGLWGKQKAAIEVAAIGRYEVDFSGRVGASPKTVGASP
jgi:hypothetical protein